MLRSVFGHAARVRSAMTLLALATLAACAPTTPQRPAAASSVAAVPQVPAPARALPANYTISGGGLNGFFSALKALESKTTEHVTIVQIGDSHTAGDYFSGELRSQFQQRFGNAGRGMMQAGLPFLGVRQKEVSIAQGGTWKVSNSLTAPTAVPYDIDGFVSTSASANASMTLDVVDPGFFDRARVDFLKKPQGGMLEIRVDGERRETVSTAGTLDEPGHVMVTVPGAHELQVVAQTPGTRIASWSVERFASGVLLENFGVISATAGLMDQWDPVLVRANLSTLAPALIILAYGTNEGFGNNFDATAYSDEFSKILARLHHDAPGASILVVGPPLAARTDARCLKAGNANNCHWVVPPAIYAVREIQQRAAAESGDAFWDWSQVMVQDGGVDAWFHVDPALLRPDHVHQTVAGYERSGTSLFGWLMHRYDVFRQSDQGGARTS